MFIVGHQCPVKERLKTDYLFYLTSISKECCESSRKVTVALIVFSLRSLASSDARTLYVPLEPPKARRDTLSIIPDRPLGKRERKRKNKHTEEDNNKQSRIKQFMPYF